MLKKFIWAVIAPLVFFLPHVLGLVGLASAPEDLNTWGKWFTAIGATNFIAIALLLFSAYLFWDEVRRRNSANPIDLMHSLFRRRKFRSWLSRIRWYDHVNVIAIQSPPRRVCALTLKGQNRRPSSLIIKSAKFISNSPTNCVACTLNNNSIPTSGFHIAEWSYFTLRAELNQLTFGQFEDNWEEFRLVVDTNRGEFTEYFSAPEIDAIMYREQISRLREV